MTDPVRKPCPPCSHACRQSDDCPRRPLVDLDAIRLTHVLLALSVFWVLVVVGCILALS